MTNHCRLLEESDGKIKYRLNDSSFVLTLQINHLLLRLWHCPYTIRNQSEKRNPVEIYPEFYMPSEYWDECSGIFAPRVGYIYEDAKQFEQDVFHVRIPVPAVTRCTGIIL